MHRKAGKIKAGAMGHTNIQEVGEGRAKKVGRYRGENGITNTKRGEDFKEGMVICVTAPKLRT